MNSKKAFLIYACIIIFLLLPVRKLVGKGSEETVLIGCTPGDPLIKSLLNILPKTNVDFIKWNLTLKSSSARPNAFVLTIVFGEEKPNAPGFKHGGEKRSFEGEYFISNLSYGEQKRTVYQIKSNSTRAITISMVKINDNLYHILTPGNQLMVGNGGWSYTLNRKMRVASDALPSLTTSSSLLQDTVKQVIFEGRTPFLELGGENSPACLKIKWKLILNKDPKTLSPTTYQLFRSNDAENEIRGTWSIIKGSAANADAVIYKLDPDTPGMSIFLFAADENVIFFLDKTSQLAIGNGDYSYTLNKKKKSERSDRLTELKSPASNIAATPGVDEE